MNEKSFEAVSPAKMRAIAELVGSQLPPELGFTVLVFGYEDDPRMSYLSTGTRETMVEAMREFIDMSEREFAAARLEVVRSDG